MMKRFLVFSLVVIGSLSCGDKVAKDILSIKQMQEIQWDLMRADELVEYYHSEDSLYPTRQRREDYYNKIFSLHHTNKDVFTRSLNYYTARPQQLKLIIDSVQAGGERMAAADTTKSGKDTVALVRDTSHIPPAIDSLKRKKFLKVR